MFFELLVAEHGEGFGFIVYGFIVISILREGMLVLILHLKETIDQGILLRWCCQLLLCQNNHIHNFKVFWATQLQFPAHIHAPVIATQYQVLPNPMLFLFKKKNTENNIMSHFFKIAVDQSFYLEVTFSLSSCSV